MALLSTYGAVNLQIVHDKSQHIETEMLGDPLVTADLDALSVSVDQWYKVTCTSQMEVRYNGMTKQAARDCWDWFWSRAELSSAVWEYGYDSSTHKYGFHRNAQKRMYQRISDVQVVHDEGNMYHVEARLEYEDVTYTRTPATLTSFSYPSLFNSVPGYS